MEFGYANYTKCSSLLPNADNVAKKQPAHAAGLQKTAKMSTAPPCTVSAACFKTTGAINKKKL